MKNNKEPKVDISGMTEEHVRILFQTLADIIGEKEGFEAKVTVIKKLKEGDTNDNSKPIQKQYY